MKHLKSLTKAQWLAIAISIFFVGVTFVYVVPSLYDWNQANTDLQKARIFHIGFFYYYNRQQSTPEGTIPDIKIDLTVNYPRGTLIVDDPVTISGIAVLNSSIPEHTISVTIYFQNALAYPLMQDSNNMTEGQDIILGSTENSSRLAGNSTMTWALEGTYHPYFGATFENGTGRYITPSAYSPDVAITVYPKQQFAQIETNNVSMILTIGVYLLTLAGTGSLVLSLWDRHPTSQKGSNNPTNQNKQTNIANDDSKKRISGKSDGDNAKSDDIQTH